MKQVLVGFWAITGCAALSTEVKIPERPLPAQFLESAEGTDTDLARWQDWFKDPQLYGLITEALSNNLDVQITLQRVEQARAGVKSATGALLPQVGLSVGGGVRRFGLYTMDGAGNATTDITPGRLVPEHLPDLIVGLQASWEVDLWGRLRHQRASALAQYLASVEGTNLVVSTLVSDVAIAYFDLLALDHIQATLKQFIIKQEQALEIVRLQMSAGRTNQLAVQQFEAQLIETRTLAREVMQQTVEAENRLHLLLGQYPETLVRDPASLLMEPRPLSAGIPAALLRNRPDVRAAELQIQATRSDLEAARAAFFPNLMLTAGVGLQAFDPRFLFRLPESLAYSVLGGLVAPLVNRKAIEAEFEGAKATQIEALYQYQKQS